MVARDLHETPFDDATKAKLDIFEKYIETWLPVFIQSSWVNSVVICDYFAGPGTDKNERPGSPLRILKVLQKYKHQIVENAFQIKIILNEYDEAKATKLSDIISKKNPGIAERFDGLVTLSCFQQEFHSLFRSHYDELRGQPNLLFFDQNGVKEIPECVFQDLINLEKTDFLFFISSSYFRRFAKLEFFRKFIPDLSVKQLQDSKPEDVHRIVTEAYQRAIPEGNDTNLYPFSLKKGANIYGLIFGSKHPLGVEKFLKIAWDQNSLNGEANFDIDGDLSKQPDLFEESRSITKKMKFESDLEKLILKEQVLTNRDVLNFTLLNGHIPAHAKPVLSKLKKTGKVTWDGRMPGLSYTSCFSDHNLREIKVVSNG